MPAAYFCPVGALELSPGVSTLGNIQKTRFALKGREITWANTLRTPPKRNRVFVSLRYLPLAKIMRTNRNWSDCGPISIGASPLVLMRLTWRPFRARHAGGRFPGLKPWAKPYSPFGAKDI